MSTNRQFGTVKTIGDKIYPKLSVSTVKTIGGESKPLTYEKYVFLTNYSETYAARWQIGSGYGQFNPDADYGGTKRTVSISFTLAARSQDEGQHNLKYCSELAKLVYIGYDKIGTGLSSDEGGYQRNFGTLSFDALTAKNVAPIHVNFGMWLRYVKAYVTKFDFDVDLYEALPALLKGDAVDLEMYPRAINVTMELFIIDQAKLGWGGAARGGASVSKGWSLNNGHDWPHGVGRKDENDSADWIDWEDGSVATARAGKLPIGNQPEKTGYKQVNFTTGMLQGDLIPE